MEVEVRNRHEFTGCGLAVVNSAQVEATSGPVCGMIDGVPTTAEEESTAGEQEKYWDEVNK